VKKVLATESMFAIMIRKSCCLNCSLPTSMECVTKDQQWDPQKITVQAEASNGQNKETVFCSYWPCRAINAGQRPQAPCIDII
jgi:hypothetical protein